MFIRFQAWKCTYILFLASRSWLLLLMAGVLIFILLDLSSRIPLSVSPYMHMYFYMERNGEVYIYIYCLDSPSDYYIYLSFFFFLFVSSLSKLLHSVL